MNNLLTDYNRYTHYNTPNLCYIKSRRNRNNIKMKFKFHDNFSYYISEHFYDYNYLTEEAVYNDLKMIIQNYIKHLDPNRIIFISLNKDNKFISKSFTIPDFESISIKKGYILHSN